MAPVKPTAPTKRKRGTAYKTSRGASDFGTITSNRKKRKTNVTSYVEDESEDDLQDDLDLDEETRWFTAKEILKERPGEYFIDWLEPDSNGNPYPPNWVPKENVTKALAAAWKQKKKKKKKEGEKNTPKKPTSKRPAASPAVKRTRPVIESSAPSTPTTQRATVTETPKSRTGSASPFAARTTPRLSRRPALQVQIRPPSDFEPTEYERFSQLPASTSTTAQSSQRQNIEEAGVVLDSQSSNGSGSYNPSVTVTTTSGSSLQPTPASANVGTGGRAVPPEPEPHSPSQEDSLQVLEIPESPAQQEPVLLEQDKNSHTHASFGEGTATSVPQASSGSPTVTGATPVDTRHSEPPSAHEQTQNVSATLPYPLVPTFTNFPRRSVSPLFEPELPPLESPKPVQTQDQPLTGTDEELSHQQQTDQRVRRRDFATVSQATNSVTGENTTQQSLSHLEQRETQQEQNAQIVPTNISQISQSDSGDRVRLSIETQSGASDCGRSSNSGQRTSQKSPIEHPSATSSAASSALSESLPLPPIHSIETPDSALPPRPETPVNTSSLSAQMAEDAESGSAKRGDDDYDVHRSTNPFVARKRTFLTASPAGTRSPSTIPDRGPQQTQEPISLRNAALVNSAATQIPEAPSLAPASAVPRISKLSKSPETPKIDSDRRVDDEAESGINRGQVQAEEIPNADVADEGMAEPSDDEDTGSVLDDDVQLQPGEFIVPLPMDGRQKLWYVHEIQRAKDLLTNFLYKYHDFDRVDEVTRVFQRLKQVEAHVDLIYAGTESPREAIGPQTQARWDYENCVKFQFLGALFDALKEEDMHIVVVVQEDDERLLDMLEKFCQGRLINYIYPAKGRRADPSDASENSETEGRVTMTILSVHSSFVVRPPDVIISLNGAETSTIRKKNWAVHPDRRIVPVIHPLVPRSLSHIERHVPTTLGAKRRLHTIFGALSQIHDKIGRPLVPSPRAPEAAVLVAQYLTCPNNSANGKFPDWPLPSICSIRDVVGYLGEDSPEQVASPVAVPDASSRAISKRPLDVEEHLDPSKRLRLTPQPPRSSPSANEAAEVTHVSDSMPGTAAEPMPLPIALAQISQLQKELAETKEAVKEKEKLLDNAQAWVKHHRSQAATWDKRQNEFEDLYKKYLSSLGKEKTLTAQTEQGAQRLKSLQQRYDNQSAELEKARAEVKEMNRIHASSDDDKDKTIVELRLDLGKAKETERRAISSKATAESNIEYMRGEYQNAQNRASELTTENSQLSADNAKLQQQASGVAVELKKLTLDKSWHLVKDQADKWKNENEALRKMMERKDEEIARLKQPSQRSYGTRGSSLPRSPNPRQAGSRAASPMGGRDRVNTLRNG
ncbi:hypothetical protein K491DRAFT_691330 [Lophiostoma macrostomum CBS 122681]|uniref:Chromo domain-containing protein n=1 Tax=Lophiostoma macrostomum CBS 122681 TaxID=1314788 RepID=A0A6A6TCU0_9PLEO|nr:hypothetical protein K491DRAFT_691330 [Lophiostoma macrostomum CBS 122681]